MCTKLSTLSTDAAPTDAALTSAVASYLADRNPNTYQGVKEAALAILPISCGHERADAFTTDRPISVPGVVALVLSAQSPDLAPQAEGEGDGGGWKPAARANEGYFGEIRVVMDAALSTEEVAEAIKALEFALKETVWSGPLAPPTAVLEFPFNSRWVGRSNPDWSIAFNVAYIRILHGSDIRHNDRMGAGTRGTKEVEGIGAKRCKIEFFVR